MESEAKLVLLEPADKLIFVGPFTRQLQNTIKITNPNKNSEVLFKIKTTAPKLYCVRPNCGTISPEQTVTIQIGLQPFDFESNALSKAHKFLIQVAQSPTIVENVNEFWKKVDQSDVWNAKIKCLLILDHDEESFNQKEGGDSFDNDGALVNVKPQVEILENSNGKMLAEEVNEVRKQVEFLRNEYRTLARDLQYLNVMYKDSAETKREMRLISRRNSKVLFAMITFAIGIACAYLGMYIM